MLVFVQFHTFRICYCRFASSFIILSAIFHLFFLVQSEKTGLFWTSELQSGSVSELVKQDSHISSTFTLCLPFFSPLFSQTSWIWALGFLFALLSQPEPPDNCVVAEMTIFSLKYKLLFGAFALMKLTLIYNITSTVHSLHWFPQDLLVYNNMQEYQS